MKTKKFKAIPCKHNKHIFYLLVLDSVFLEKTAYVSNRETNAKLGFQRNLNKTRALEIAEYLDSGNLIPSAIILSAQSRANFKFNKSTSEITVDEAENTLLVLDGQHRLYGILEADNEYQVPAVIFQNLTFENEVNLFIDINTNQKGVPTTLLLDIKNLTGKETSLETKQRRLFDSINKDGVLAGKLSSAKSLKGCITRVSFNQATKEIFEKGFFADKDHEVINKGIQNYLAAVDKVFKDSKSEKAKLTSSTFFKAAFNIFNETIEKTLSKHKNLKKESLIDVLNPISTIVYDNYTGTSNATLSKLSNEMKKELNEITKKYSVVSSKNFF